MIYTLEQIKKWNCDLDSKVKSLVNSEIKRLQNEGHLRSYSMLWNDTKYCNTRKEIKEKLIYSWKYAMNKVKEHNPTWMWEWFEVANDIQHVQLLVLQLEAYVIIPQEINKAVDKALADLIK